jgi:hypothetical protein
MSESKESKKNNVACFGCADNLALDHTGIKCLQNHHMCTDCSKNYINLIFSEPLLYLPAWCPNCKTEILVNTIEMQLKEEDLERFQNLCLIYSINESIDLQYETIVCCPFCSYTEIRQKDGINFIFCRNEKCLKRSCYFCHLECEYEDDNDHDNDNVSNETESSDAIGHFQCALNNPLKKKIEKAIEEGSKVECPKCKTAGRKDTSCTHMTCVKCNTVYCYICGLSEDDCDKEGEDKKVKTTIYQHNINWSNNELRCPMYLNEIFEVDQR